MLVTWPFTLTNNVPEKACCCWGLNRTAKRNCCEGGTEAGNAGRFNSWKAGGEAVLIATESTMPVPAPLLLTTIVTDEEDPDAVFGKGIVDPSVNGRVLLVSGSM